MKYYPTRSKLDLELGLKYYVTNNKHYIQGIIRAKPEDFIVKEVIPPGIVLEWNTQRLGGEGDYILILLEKRNIDHWTTLKLLSDTFKLKIDDINTIGIKDTKAITYQMISIPKTIVTTQLSYDDIIIIAPSRDKQVRLRKIGEAVNPLKPGLNIGNKFNIKISGAKNIDKLQLILEELKYRNNTLLAYYMYQRFGTIRPNTHKIGQKILEEKWQDAVIEATATPYPKESTYIKKLRAAIREAIEEENITKILKIANKIPESLWIEKKILKELGKTKLNYYLAIKKLPTKILKIYIQAYLSYLYNLYISKRVEEAEENRVLIGEYLVDMKTGAIREAKSERRIKEHERILLVIPPAKTNRIWRNIPNIDIEKLKAKLKEAYKKLNIKVRYIMRPLTTKAKIEKISVNNDIKISFTMEKGQYATLLLRELLKPVDPPEQGF